MKGSWKVTSNVIDGRKVYAVYRLIDITQPDHSGNREFASGWTEDRAAAHQAAKELNEA